MFRWDDRADAVIIACVSVITFGIVARVGEDAPQFDALLSGFQRLAKIVNIGSRSTSGLEGQLEMIAGIANDAQFGITIIDMGGKRGRSSFVASWDALAFADATSPTSLSRW